MTTKRDRLTIKEAADMIGVKPGTIYNWKSLNKYSDHITFHKLAVRGRVFLLRVDVEKFIDYYEKGVEEVESDDKGANGQAKRRAQNALNVAVQAGRATRQPCMVCGAVERVHGHHEDYSKPLDVVWLCALHHRARHREIKEEQKHST